MVSYQLLSRVGVWGDVGFQSDLLFEMWKRRCELLLSRQRGPSRAGPSGREKRSSLARVDAESGCPHEPSTVGMRDVNPYQPNVNRHNLLIMSFCNFHACLAEGGVRRVGGADGLNTGLCGWKRGGSGLAELGCFKQYMTARYSRRTLRPLYAGCRRRV